MLQPAAHHRPSRSNSPEVVLSPKHNSRRGISASPKGAAADPDKLFESIDTDNSGVISRDEWNQAHGGGNTPVVEEEGEVDIPNAGAAVYNQCAPSLMSGESPMNSPDAADGSIPPVVASPGSNVWAIHSDNGHERGIPEDADTPSNSAVYLPGALGQQLSAAEPISAPLDAMVLAARELAKSLRRPSADGVGDSNLRTRADRKNTEDRAALAPRGEHPMPHPGAGAYLLAVAALNVHHEMSQMMPASVDHFCEVLAAGDRAPWSGAQAGLACTRGQKELLSAIIPQFNAARTPRDRMMLVAQFLVDAAKLEGLQGYKMIPNPPTALPDDNKGAGDDTPFEILFVEDFPNGPDEHAQTLAVGVLRWCRFEAKTPDGRLHSKLFDLEAGRFASADERDQVLTSKFPIEASKSPAAPRDQHKQTGDGNNPECNSPFLLHPLGLLVETPDRLQAILEGLDGLFDFMDRDQDGVITETEFQQAYMNAFPKLVQGGYKDLSNELSDELGQLELANEEPSNGPVSMAVGAESDTATQPGSKEAELEIDPVVYELGLQIFNQIDSDGDGSISLAEWANFAAKPDIEQLVLAAGFCSGVFPGDTENGAARDRVGEMGPTGADELFDKLDRDHDGFISRDEWNTGAVDCALAGGAPAGGVPTGGAPAGGVLAGGAPTGGLNRLADGAVALYTPSTTVDTTTNREELGYNELMPVLREAFPLQPGTYNLTVDAADRPTTVAADTPCYPATKGATQLTPSELAAKRLAEAAERAKHVDEIRAAAMKEKAVFDAKHLAEREVVKVLRGDADHTSSGGGDHPTQAPSGCQQPYVGPSASGTTTSTYGVVMHQSSPIMPDGTEADMYQQHSRDVDAGGRAASLDADGAAVGSSQEWEAVNAGVSAEVSGEEIPDGADPELYKQALELFDMIDADGNGEISLSEWREFQQPDNADIPLDVSAVLKDVDTVLKEQSHGCTVLPLGNPSATMPVPNSEKEESDEECAYARGTPTGVSPAHSAALCLLINHSAPAELSCCHVSLVGFCPTAIYCPFAVLQS